MNPPRPSDEEERLIALERYEILDTAPEEAYEDVARLASQICGTPIALVSFVDADRQWFKAKIGLDAAETSRDVPFCAHTLVQSDILIVPDAAQDPRFADSPLVTGEPRIRFYAGLPLVTSEGLSLGALCVIDRVPRDLSDAQKEALRSLARLVMHLLTLRSAKINETYLWAERQALEQKRACAETEARNQSIRHKALLDAAPDCIITIDSRDTIVGWNAAAERTFGWTSREAIGQSVLDTIIPEAYRHAHHRGVLRLLETGEERVLNRRRELVASRRDGTEFPCELTVIPFEEDGEFFFTAYLHDISERHAAEQALRESEEHFRISVEAMEEGLVLQDADGAIQMCNGSAERILGLSADQMTGRTSLDRHWRAVRDDGTDFPGELHPAMRALREGIPQRNVAMGVHKPDGRLVWVSITAVPLFHAGQDRAHGVVVTFSDITEQREADLMLQRMLVQSEHLLAAIPSVLIAVDGGGVISAWNSAAERVFGVFKSATVGAQFEQCTLSWDWGRISAALEDCRATGAAVRLEDVEYRRPDGAERLLGLNFSPLPRVQGQSDGFLLLAADITERRQSQEALQRSLSLLKAEQEASDAGLLLIDEQGDVASFNDNFCKIWNVPDEITATELSVKGKDQHLLEWALSCVEDPEAFIAKVQSLYENPSVKDQTEIPLKDGRILERYSSAVISPTGENYGRIWYFRDITERKRAEDALREAQERIETVVNWAPMILFALDRDGVFTLAEGRGLDALETSSGEMLGRSIWDIYGDVPGIADALRRSYAGDPQSDDLWIGELCFETRMSPLIADEGVVGVLGVALDITERKRAEEALRQSQERYQRSADNVPGMVYQFLLRPDGSFSYPFVSEGCREVYGLDPQVVMRDAVAITQVLHPEDRDSYFRSGAEASAALKPWRWEGRVILAGGEIRWLQGAARPNLLENGDILWDGLMMDVTAGKQTGEALRVSNQRLSTLLQAAPVAIFNFDDLGRVQSWNPAAERIFGWSAAEVLGQVLPFVPDDRQEESHNLRERLESGETFVEVEELRRRRDGRLISVSLSAAPLQDGEGRFTGAIAVVADISERRRAEAELLSSAQRILEQTAERDELSRRIERLSLVATKTTNAVVITDAQGRIEWTNDSFTRITGYDAGEVLGLKPSSFLQGPATDPDVKARLRAAIQNCEQVEAEIYNYHKTGHGYWLALSINPLFADDGVTVQGFIGIETDITERKQAQEKLAQSARELEERNWELAEARDAALAVAKLKSEFLANMSHEIRTPMNGVIGMVDLLLDTPLVDEQRFFARTVKSSADSLMTVINDILDFSKLEAGKMTVEHIPFSLRETLEDVAGLLATQAHDKGLDFICALPPLGMTPSTERLLGDPGRLRQIVTNLLGNAIKFTARGGGVVVGAETLSESATSAHWRIFVRDTGIGIPPDRRAMIFESFTQADGSTTRRYGGTGLGLTISRQLATLMGGEIGVDSEVGRGSTFWIELTLEKQQGESQHPTPSHAALTGVRVLPTGMSHPARTEIARWMTAWGCILVEDNDLETSPDVVLLDADGTADGPAVRARFLASAPPTLPVLLLTGAITAQVEGTPRPSLRKPIRQAALYEALCVLTGRREPASGGGGADAAQERQAAPVWRGRILLAEDNPVNQMVAQRLLARLGFGADAVTTVSTGRQALDALKDSDFALVLMDVQMPEMDGLEAVAALRAQEDGDRLPVVAMTAHAMTGDRERCLEAGMSDYVSKPISPEKLAEVIGRWMPQLITGKENDMTPTLSEQGPSIDAATLAAVSGGDRGIEADLAREFARSAPGMIAHCRRDIEARDGAGLEHWAHTLKGSGLIFGATSLVSLCQTLETLGHQGALDQAAPIIQALEAEWARVQTQLTGLWKREQVG